ncbi:MAG TPA: hypothetical protein DET40_04570 [Lentisphaeria bacterium]|nr:MAG: hypothetical protein A2X45_21550 [Lentisphaerae bacterium GWF2_50_93]HCE42800.1 hypothetical protein [Lentisphaeria bacterium]
MTYYKILVLTARDVHHPGISKQVSGNEYIHSIVIHLSDEDSSWPSFDEAKNGAISFIKKFCNHHTMDLDEVNRSNRKLHRLESLTENDMLSMMKPGQKIFNV